MQNYSFMRLSRIDRLIKSWLVVMALPLVIGCGGSNGDATPKDTISPLITDAVLTAQPSQTVNLLSAAASTPLTNVPLVSQTGSLSVRVKVTDASGVNTMSHPPVVAAYNEDGTEFSSPQNMSPSPDQTNIWTATIHVIVSQAGLYNGIKIVTVSAHDTAGNQLTQPIGLYIYSNPR